MRDKLKKIVDWLVVPHVIEIELSVEQLNQVYMILALIGTLWLAIVIGKGF